MRTRNTLLIKTMQQARCSRCVRSSTRPITVGTALITPQFQRPVGHESCGPRPLPVSDYKRISEEDSLGGYFRQRARTKPGMTGLWQISGRSELGFREMVLLDLYYVENQSILFDIEILAQTLPVVFFGKGAY